MYSIREADLKTHDNVYGVGSDIGYETYLMNKIAESTKRSIEEKYYNEKKHGTKVKLNIQQVEAFLLAGITLVVVALFQYMYYTKIIDVSASDAAVTATYNIVNNMADKDCTELMSEILE